MSSLWVIEHDNGIKGKHVYSDGFVSLVRASEYAMWLQRKGVTVYRIVRDV